jgi:NADPH:quinone reductase-like Zn-dependent oxidoreductase
MLNRDGKLVVIETVTAQPRRHTFIHGLRESVVEEKDAGFDTRTGEPTKVGSDPCSVEAWDRTLCDTGFSGANLVFPNHTDNASDEMSIIVSAAEPRDIPQPICPITIVSDPEIPGQGEIAAKLAELLGPANVDHYSLEEALTVDIAAESIMCVLSEIRQPVLANITDQKFQHLQQLFSSSAEKVLWVNSGSGDSSSPSFRAIDGLFRVLNSELTAKTFATLSIEEAPDNVDAISRVIRSMANSPCPETEYVERSGLLHIPRLINATETSHSLSEKQPSQALTLQSWNAESARKLSIKTPGLLDSIHFIEDTDRQSPLPAHMFEVKVKAVGVNFRDILIMLGRMDQTTVGFECAGIVTRVGEDCGDFKIGDRVVGCEFDTYRSYARLQRDTAVRIPEGISFTEAAAIPINFITAWHALVALSNVQRGERVLIHSAAGGTGQAAVQVAQYFGAEVFATVGNVKKKQFLMERYGIPETHIFSSRTLEFVRGIKHLTGGQGADVVLNSLSGDALTASWEIIAPYGRFIEIGKRDILNHRPLDMYHFEKNVTFSAIDVAMMVKERPALVGRALRAVMPLIASGALRISSPHHVYGIGEMETAFRALQGGQSSGKVVLEMRDADIVRVCTFPPPGTRG